jgi:hypothetical protein
VDQENHRGNGRKKNYGQDQYRCQIHIAKILKIGENANFRAGKRRKKVQF